MNMKTRQTSGKGEVSSSEKSFPNIFADLGRHQLALAVEGASALCRGSEALRKIQQEAAHEASAFYEDVAKKLFTPCQPAELMAIQSELLGFSLQSAGKYWQKIAAQAMQVEVEVMKSVSHVLETEKETGMKSPLEAFQAAMPPLAHTFFPMSAQVPNGQALHS
jgi:hypothetical protein